MSTSFIYLGGYMEEQQRVMIAVDMLCLMVGIEHYYTLDEAGNTLENKSFEVYFKERTISSGKISRSFLVNVETDDSIEIDQDGICINTDSEDRDILDLSGMHSFQECVEELIKSTENIVLAEPDGDKTIAYFKALRDHMTKSAENGTPAYIDAEDMDHIVDSISNLYVLSFGNPLTQEPKLRCLYNFKKNIGQTNK